MVAKIEMGYSKVILAVLISTLGLCFSLSSMAIENDELKELEGFTLAEIWTIEEFEGCEWDKKIDFIEGYTLICSDYGYNYSYYVDAFIFTNGSQIKMLVDDEIYDMLTSG